MVHVVLIAALAWGVQWRLVAPDKIAAPVPGPNAPAQTAALIASTPSMEQPPIVSESATTAQMGAGAENSPAPERDVRPKPSFDCAKARSFAERTICADAELARLDRDLGRLHVSAKRAADDPAAFRRQNDAEWRRRERTCRDRSCLMRWYADRRQQLAHYVNEPWRNR